MEIPVILANGCIMVLFHQQSPVPQESGLAVYRLMGAMEFVNKSGFHWDIAGN